MTITKRDLLFALRWANLAVAVVLLVLLLANQISSGREFLHIALYSFLFANLTGLAGVVLLDGLAAKFFKDRNVLPLVAGVVLVITPLGCLLAEIVMIGAGLASRGQFWRDYLHTLRVALPLATVFGAGAITHASLRGRLQAMEKNLREKAVAEERARKEATEARLRLLEAQIHPHFLFNTLNAISALISVNPARAEHIVGRLSALLRASLDTRGQPLIPLRQELELVESYLDIERARFGDRLGSSIHVAPELETASVPPMSVQSLVENAVKHGIHPLPAGGEVTVTVAAENGALRISVRDTGPGFDLSSIPAGHGLDHLVSRLDALFGPKARLNVIRESKGTIVEIVLPRA